MLYLLENKAGSTGILFPKHIVDFKETCLNYLDILVWFEVTTGTTFRHGAFLIPVVRNDAATDVHFGDLSAHGDTDKDRILPVAKSTGFPCNEGESEIRIV